MVYTSQLTSGSPQTIFFSIPFANTAFLTISHTLSFPRECYDLACGPSVPSCAFAQTLCLRSRQVLLAKLGPGCWWSSRHSQEQASVTRSSWSCSALGARAAGSHHSASSSASSALLWQVLREGRGEERTGHQPGNKICPMLAGISMCFPDRHAGNPRPMSTTQFLLQNLIPWKTPIETGGTV